MAAMVVRHRISSRLSFLSLLSARSSSSAPASADSSGVRTFLEAIGQDVKAHGEKLEAESGTLSDFLKVRGRYLKGLGIPCKQRKLILRYTEKYRQGTWRPSREEAMNHEKTQVS